MTKRFFVLTILLLSPSLLYAPNTNNKNKQHMMSVPLMNLPTGIYEKKKNKEIVLGFSVPLTGGRQELGRDLALGVDLVFNKINKMGGIKGYFLKLLVKDDRNTAMQSKKNVDFFLRKTSLLFNPFMTGGLKAIPKNVLPELLVLFPFSGASSFRAPENRSLFFYKPSFHQEMEALVVYIKERLALNKVAIVYEASGWGREMRDAAKEHIDAYGLTNVIDASYPAQTVNVGEAVKKILVKMPDTVICIGNAQPIYMFIKEAVNKGLTHSVFLGSSSTEPAQKRLLMARGIKMIVASSVPNPWISDIPLAQRYRKAMEKIQTSPSVFSFEAFVSASIFVEALKAITPPFTKKKIATQLESMQNVTIHGLHLNFDMKSRSLSHPIWLSLGPKKKWPSFDPIQKKLKG